MIGIKQKNKTSATAVFLLVLLSACNRHAATDTVSYLPYYHQPDFTPVWLTPSDDSVKKIHTIAPFAFTNQHGKEITQSFTDGKIYFTNFFFTSCGSICPKMTKHMKKVQEHVKSRNDILFLMHSVTPWMDTVNRLVWYAQKFDLNGTQWQLLTGNRNDIYKLARQSYFAEEQAGFNRDSSEFIHSEHILLIDRHRHIRGIYNGTLELEVNRMMDDLTLLMKEN